MKTTHRIVLNMLLGAICLVLILISYFYFISEKVDEAIYSILLTLLGGATFLYFHKAYSVKSEETIEKLSKASVVKDLIQEAETKTSEIENLKAEMKKIEDIVEESAKKYYLEKRYNMVEEELIKRYDELRNIEKELEFSNLDYNRTLTKEQIEKIEKYIKQREHGDIIIKIGEWRIPFPRSLFDIYPFGIGEMLYRSLSYRARKKRFEELKNKSNNSIEEDKGEN